MRITKQWLKRYQFRREIFRGLLASALLLLLVGPPVSTLVMAAEVLELGVDNMTLAIPDGWSSAEHANFHRIYNVTDAEQASIDSETLQQIIYISVFAERQSDHSAALQQLREIGAVADPAAAFLEIGGWPAVQHQRVISRPQAGATDSDAHEMALVIVTAVAVDDVLVRLEAWLPPDSSAAETAAVKSIGASLTGSPSYADPEQIEQELQELQADPLQGLSLFNSSVISSKQSSGAETFSAGAAINGAPAAGSTVRVTNQGGTDGELEMTVADGGKDIVIGSNNGFFFSSDGGATWANSSGLGSNDPSVAWGQSGGTQGTFYAANISGTTTGFWTSTDGGANFTGTTPAYTCGQAGDPACGSTFPDQEHIAADRFNVTGTGDQVYSAWRHLDGNWGIVCSNDGGTNWSTNGLFFSGDFPKITAGQDGFVYVVYHPSSDDDIRVRKLNSCETNQNPMVVVSDALVVTNPTSVACPTAGLDRCNFRNTLASPTVAVDDTDANHIFVAYASNTNPGGGGWWPNCLNQNTCNEAIIVQDSIDGGATWSPGDPNRTVQISSSITARRFMPWACTAGGEVFVSWFDRRAASPGGITVSNNSLTDFYRGSAALNVVGNLSPGAEKQVNEVGSTDAQCEAGATLGANGSWPGPTDSTNNVAPLGDSESCSAQPQQAGRCCNAADTAGGRCGGNPPAPTSSGQRCDFSSTACPAGETCRPNRGVPKYGDYNGSACAEGRFYTTWASATAPPSITPASTGIDTFFASDLVCCASQIQVPSDVKFGQVCDGSAVNTATLEVCNTGAENLQVATISSDNPRFAVTDPQPGYPVTISPDFCFNFEVTMNAAGGAGAQVGTLTIPTNDPVNPSLDVSVTGDIGTPDINVAIADTGDFGKVCKTEQADLGLSIINQGTCNLTISNIDLIADDGSFELPNDLDLPLVLSPDADFTVPTRFAPQACSDVPENRTVRISSDSPGETTVNVDISGVSPCPNLVVDSDLTGLFAFPATVVDTGSTLGCYSDQSLNLRNNGECPLSITDISTDGADFAVTEPSSFPIVLPSGEETLGVTVRFTPQTDANPLAPSEILGQLTVMSDDPDGDDFAELCGESVAQSGVRVLVTDQSGPVPVPISNVDVITLQSKGIHSPSPINLRFKGQALSAGIICGNNIQYHVDQETLPAVGTTGNDPNSSYTTKASDGNLKSSRSFGLTQCEFQDFQLQLEDSASPACLLAPKGDACSTDGECCSGRCRGKSGNKVCK